MVTKYDHISDGKLFHVYAALIEKADWLEVVLLTDIVQSPLDRLEFAEQHIFM